MINAIVCVDENWGIGYQGELLARIPEDMKRFKELTQGNAVIMGRKTWDSLPNGSLPNRLNFVITSNHPQEEYNNTLFFNFRQFKSVMKLRRAVDKLGRQRGESDIQDWVIGGASIYEQLLPYCGRIYLTKIYKAFENVDTYFPEVDSEKWKIIEESDIKEYNGLKYQFITYEKLDFSEKL